MRRREFLGFVALASVVATPAFAQAHLNVVATFSILADFVKQVGGDRVAVTSLVGPNADTHVFSPSPKDARTIAEAAVVVVNGLGYEGWLSRLVKASGTKARIVVASQGVKVRQEDEAGGHSHSGGHAHGNDDPHAWQSVANAKIYVANIRDALAAADPAGARTYAENAKAYLAQLDALEAEIRDAIVRIPAERRKVITTHEAFGYFGAAYGMRFIAPTGLSTDAEPSARDVARLIAQVKRQKVPAVFLENASSDRLMQQIARETGAKIGGALYADSLSPPDGPAPTYIDMMRNNLRAITGALGG